MLRIEESFEYQLRRLRADKDKLHLLCPAGIGDIAWIGAKLFPLARQRGNFVFQLPGIEQRRAGEYLELFGLSYEYMPKDIPSASTVVRQQLTTRWVWDQQGSPELPKTGAVAVQANRHLEAGNRIEDWYPKLKTVWPVPEVEVKDSAMKPFTMLFPGSRNYMGGNLSVGEWARVVAWLHKHIAPVRLVGAGQDVEFVQAIGGLTPCTMLLDRPIAEILAAATSPHCRLFMGVASGPLIASTYMGGKCFMAYPEHLSKMPGSWEPDGVLHDWCMVRDLPQRVRERGI